MFFEDPDGLKIKFVYNSRRAEMNFIENLQASVTPNLEPHYSRKYLSFNDRQVPSIPGNNEAAVIPIN